MKRSIRFVAIAMALLMLCVALTACGKKLSGEYTSDKGILGETTYKFSGSKVEISYKSILGTVHTVNGTYEINDDEITITLDDGDEDSEDLGGTFAFEETDDGIKIGMIEYKKA